MIKVTLIQSNIPLIDLNTYYNHVQLFRTPARYYGQHINSLPTSQFNCFFKSNFIISVIKDAELHYRTLAASETSAQNWKRYMLKSPLV